MARRGRRPPNVESATTEGARRLLREVESLTTTIVGQRIGVSQVAVSLWCRGVTRPAHGHRVALESIFFIPCDAWDVDLENK